MKTFFTCPVCYYNQMPDRPELYNICPCCGTEFDLDDDDASHEELRERWIASGCPWFSRYTLPPGLWEPTQQLVLGGYSFQHRADKPLDEMV